MGSFASTGAFGTAGLSQGCRRCANRHLSGSAMCAQFLEQKLGCHGCYRAPTVRMRAAQGQGVAAGTASSLCQKNSVEAACSKGKACSYLSAKGSVHIPSVWLTGEREACWEVQNWVKTLPDWLDDGIWFWLSSSSKSTFIPDTYFMDEMIENLVFEDYTNAFNCFKMYFPLWCSDFQSRRITSEKSSSI